MFLILSISIKGILPPGSLGSITDEKGKTGIFRVLEISDTKAVIEKAFLGENEEKKQYSVDKSKIKPILITRKDKEDVECN